MKLPEFKGANDKYLSCQQFLFIVEEMARANLWSDEEILNLVLESCSDLGLVKFRNYSELKKHLLKTHRVKNRNLKEKLELKTKFVQDEQENVEQYFGRCSKIQAQICDDQYSELLNQQELILNFVSGLKSDIKEVLINDDNDLDSILEVAVKVEKVQKSFLETEENNEIDLELDFFDDINDIFSDIFKCDQCGFATMTQDLLNDHIQSEHCKSAKFPCQFCSVKCHSKKIFNLHLQNFHPDTCFTCSQCSQIFSSESKLSAHMTIKHHSNFNTCSYCGKEYTNKNSLKAHIHAKHLSNRKFTCTVCPKEFSSSSNLKTHVRIVHLMERPYECEDCGKAYASEGGLSAHLASIHGKGERLQCDQCDMSFPYKAALRTHILNRHNRGTFICDQCGVANNTKEALRVHKITDHSEDKGKKLPCPYPECKEKFRVPFQVRNHVKRVHKKIEGTHLCSLCPKKYHSRQRLESHMNGVHLNKKPFKCPHCDFASAYQGHVKDHVRASHEAVKYPCPYPMCSHQSSYKGNLDKHIRNIHTKNAS